MSNLKLKKQVKKDYSGAFAESVGNILLGSGRRTKLTARERNLIKRNPYGDFDKDQVKNFVDCYPYSKSKQGLFQTIASWFQPPAPTPKVDYGGYETVAINPTTNTFEITGSYNAGTNTYTTSSGQVSQGAPTNLGYTSYSGTTIPVSPTATSTDNTTTTKNTTNTTKSTSSNLFGGGNLTSSNLSLGMLNTGNTNISSSNVPVSSTPKSSFNLFGVNSPEQVYQNRGKSTLSSEQMGLPVSIANMKKYGQYERAGEIETDYLTYTQQRNIDFQSKQIASQLSTDLIKQGNDKINSYVSDMQNQVDAGKISVTDANNMIDDVIKQTNANLNDQFQKKYTNAMTPIVQNATNVTNKEAQKIADKVYYDVGKRDAPKTFVTSAVIGAGLTGLTVVAPPVGLAVGGMLAGNFAYETATGATAKEMKANPYGCGANIAGGIAGGLLTGFAIKSVSATRNTAKVNEYIANKNINPTDIKPSYTFSAGKAIKLGTDYNGNTIWSIRQTGITKFTNELTGKVIDKVLSISDVKVTAKTAEGAVKSVVEGASISLKQGGWKLKQFGNKLEAEGVVSSIKGTANTYQLGKNLYGGRGNYDIASGDFRMGVTENAIKFKGSVQNPPRQSVTSNFVSTMLGKDIGAIKTPKGNILGVNEYYKTGAVSDIYQNYFINKKGQIQYFKKEPLPTRDISKSYTKSFIPKAFDYGYRDFSQSNMGEMSQISLQRGISLKQNAKLVAQSAKQAQMSAYATDVSKILIGNIKNAPPPKLIATGGIVKTSVQAGVLTGFNYPTYIDTGKQVSKTYAKTGYTYAGSVGNILLGGASVNPPKTRTITEVRNNYAESTSNAFNNAFGFASITPQIQQPQQAYRLRTAQITAQTYAYPPYVPRVNIPKVPVIPYFNLPKGNGGYGRRTYSGRTRTSKTAYTPSLAAVELGIYAPAKNKNTVYGVGIRGMINDNGYAKRISKIFIQTSKKGKVTKTRKIFNNKYSKKQKPLFIFKKIKNNYGNVNYNKSYKNNLNKLLIGGF